MKPRKIAPQKLRSDGPEARVMHPSRSQTEELSGVKPGPTRTTSKGHHMLALAATMTLLNRAPSRCGQMSKAKTGFALSEATATLVKVAAGVKWEWPSPHTFTR